MKKNLTWLCMVLLLSACGGRAMHKTDTADAAYEPIGQGVPSSMPSPEPYAAEEAYATFDENEGMLMDAAPEMKKQSDGGELQGINQMAGSSAVQQQPPAPPMKKADNGVGKPAPEEPMIVYNGYLHLRVRRLMEALDEVSRITKENGGYVDSMTQRSIVVRIPGDNFEALLEVFANLGDVLSREITAVEVTEQFTDLTSRLAVAKETRDRLLALLEKVTQAHERLRILEEIKRLSEEIESIKSTLSTLENLLKYFTVSIDLTPILEDEASVQHQSPFDWVRELTPHRTTLFGATDAMQMTLPSNFVLFSKSEDYRAQAADTTIIRGGIVTNDPKGDSSFWSDAIAYEMQGRGEILADHGTSGKVKWRLLKNDDLQPRWYLVGVHVKGDKVYVIEVFFPNEDAYNAHGRDMLKALETFEVTK